MCIDKKDMYIYGDFNSLQARLVQMQLVKCTGHDYCLSDEEISRFLRNKWLLFLFNTKRFDSNFFDEESIVKQTKAYWLNVNTQF